MTFVQNWGAPSNGNGGTSETRTGPATTAGSDLFYAVATRLSGADPDSVVITDDSGTNAWTQIGWQDIGAANLYLFHCSNAAAITSATASFFDESEDPLEVDSAIGMLEEHSNIGTLVDLEVGTVPDTGGFLTDVVPTAAGQTLIAAMATGSSNRSWGVAGADITATAQTGFQGGQLTLFTSNGVTSDTDPCGIGWNLTGGSDATIGIINAVFEEGSGAPDPLTVSVGSDQAIYVGQTASVTAVPDGGTETYTYAWTRVSGPTGTFLNANQATTTFTPTGGAGTYVLRCVVGDGNVTAQDDLVLTVTAAPDFVTVSAVNDSTSWVATGGTVLAVISDTSDSTLITSAENPSAQGLDVTFNNITLTEGQPLSLRLRARRADASSATVTARLYNGATLLSTSSATAVSSSFGDITITFPAADLTGLTYPRAFRVVTEWTATA